VADGFLPGKPTSPRSTGQATSKLNLAKDIMSVGFFPRTQLACQKVPRTRIDGLRKPQSRERQKPAQPPPRGRILVLGWFQVSWDRARLRSWPEQEPRQQRGQGAGRRAVPRGCTPARPWAAASSLPAGRERNPNSASPKPLPEAEPSAPSYGKQRPRQSERLGYTIPPTQPFAGRQRSLRLVPRASGQERAKRLILNLSTKGLAELHMQQAGESVKAAI